MRNFKKLTSVVLALAIVLTSMTVAFAATTTVNESKAIVLNQLDLYAGTSTSSFVPSLETELTRGQGAILLTKLFNMDDAALALTDAQVNAILEDFADASEVPTYAAKRLAYLVQQNIMSGSLDNGELYVNADESLLGGQFATLLLKQMGFTVDSWKASIAQLSNVEGAKEIAAYLGYAAEPILRDHAVGIMYGSLTAEYANGAATIIEKIVEAKPALKGVAVAAGLIIPVVPTVLTVESVTASNLKEIVVSFNKAVDEDTAETKGNYTLSVGTVSNAEMVGNTVILTLTAPAAQQSDVDVTVKNVKDVAGTLLVDTTKKVKMIDNTFPAVTGIKVTGPKTLEVSFSEPLQTVPTFVVDNGTYYAAPTFTPGVKTITLTLGIELSAGPHKVVVSNGTDYYNYKVPETTMEYTYTKDTAAIVASVDSTTETTVTIKFSKPVKAANLTDVTAYYAYNNDVSYRATLSAKDATKNLTTDYVDTVVATFATPIPQGSHTLYINTKTDKLEDAWGNDVASTTLAFGVTTDIIKPTVTKVTTDGDKKIIVTYSEKVTVADAQNPQYYTLKDATGAIVKTAAYAGCDANGKLVNGVTYPIDTDNKVVTITLTTPLPGGQYALSIANVRDVAYSKNTMDAATVTFTVTDKTGPTVSSSILSADAKKVRVTFSEAMSTEGLTTVANYRLAINGAASIALPDNSTVAIVDNKTVEITLGSAVAGLDATTDEIQVGGSLKDVSGNSIGGFFSTKTISTDAVAIKTDVDNKAKTTAKNVIVFKADKPLKAIDASLIKLNTATAVASAYFVNGSDDSTVTVILSSDLGTDNTGLTNIVFGAGSITNIFGTPIAAPQTIVAFDDAIAPAISTVKTTTGSALEITFSEAVNPATVSLYTFTVAGNTVTGAALDVTNKILTLSLKDAFASDAKPAVTQALDVKDVAGNVLVAGTTVAATTDGVAPTVMTPYAVASIAANTSVTVIFSEGDINAASKTAIQNAITAGASAATLTYAWSGATLTITNTNATTAVTFAADVTVAGITDGTGNVTAGAVTVIDIP